MDNKFLRDFMARQSKAAIIESPATEAPSKKGKKKSKHGTADGKHPFGGDDMETRLSQLISEKPAKKEVLAYFKDRISQLVAEDEW
jgi:hypothetical protein